MAYESIVGLHVTDESMYQQYRDAMRPILEQYGGGFRYDFRVSDVLQTSSDHDINRVFAIYCRDKEAYDAFFADEAYKAVRARYFEPSVAGATRIAAYDRAG